MVINEGKYEKHSDTFNDNKDNALNDINNKKNFNHKIPEKKDSIKNSFNNVILKVTKNDLSEQKENIIKDQSIKSNIKINNENSEKNFLKSPLRNNTTRGNFLSQNKLAYSNNNDKKNIYNSKIYKNSDDKYIKYNKLEEKNNNGNKNLSNISSIMEKTDASINKDNPKSNEIKLIKKNLTKRRLNLSNIFDVFPIHEKLNTNSKINENSPKSLNKKAKKTFNFNDFNKNNAYPDNLDPKHSRNISCMFPSSTKNISKKELYTDKFNLLSLLESKQDLMNDYPLIHNLQARVNLSHKKVEEKNINYTKDILDSTVEFNSNNYNFINLESSINLELLDNLNKDSNYNHEKVINKKENDIITEEINTKNKFLNEFIINKENNLLETKCFNESSIDRFSLMNFKRHSILLFGGKTKFSDFTTFKFNSDKEEWVKLEELKISRTDFGLLSLDNKSLLILGGKVYSLTQKENITDSIELIYLEKKLNIKHFLKMKQPRCNFGCLLFEIENLRSQDKIKLIIIAGGYNGMDVLNNFEFYDLNRKKWFDLPSMPIKRKEFGMIQDNDGIIYFLGGVDEKE